MNIRTRAVAVATTTGIRTNTMTGIAIATMAEWKSRSV